jgi:hypothetical protein
VDNTAWQDELSNMKIGRRGSARGGEWLDHRGGTKRTAGRTFRPVPQTTRGMPTTM